jgi:sugar/nucleoside kinase (ribokinase family)
VRVIVTGTGEGTVIGTVGDLVEDVIVRLAGPIQEATDTVASVIRRRGGSAANFAASVVRSGHPSRFIGHVGDDPQGSALIESLRAEGVDVIARQGGRTGTIVVVLDHLGERSMLSDRGSCTWLDHPDPGWLDGLHTLHVPAYSLVGEPLTGTTATLIGWAHARGIAVSVDASSASLINDFGADLFLAHIAELRPSVLFCNEIEAEALGGVHPDAIGAEVTVIKRGARPAIVLQLDEAPVEVPAMSLHDVRDTTGAGDGFAAGFLISRAGGGSVIAAASLGHQTAARAIAAASAQ